MPDDSNDHLQPGELPQEQERVSPRDTDSNEVVSVEVESSSGPEEEEVVRPTEQSVPRFPPPPRASAPPRSATQQKAHARMAIPVSALPMNKRAPPPITRPDQPAPGGAQEEPEAPAKVRKELLTPEAEGRYLLKREFGRGGMSSVWLAVDRHIGREVAFKQLLPQHARGGGDPVKATLQARFTNEARITGQLEHPNIVPVYEVGKRGDGATYYTLKLVKGRTLTEAIKAAKDLRERIALLPNFIALCQAMAYAHKRTVIHRDLKPDNVMVGEFGETVVLDWGLARFLGRSEFDAKDQSLASTQEGDVMGTPAYMSPEQAMGQNDQVDAQSDVWSLGAVLFEILTGRPPFQGRNLMQMLQMVAKDPPPKVRSIEPKVPPELAAVVERALTRDKRSRYRTATDLLNDVEAWRTGARVSVYQYTALQTATRWVRKNRYVVLTAALVLLAILGGAVRVWMENQVARRNLAQAYLEKASSASRDLRWGRAAAYAAVARVEDDTAEARWRAAHRGPVELDPSLRMTLPSAAEQVALSPDGKKIAVAVAGVGIKVLDASSGKFALAIDLDGPAGPMTFSADGGLLACGVGKEIRVWSSVTGEAQMRLDAAGPVGDVAFAPDGTLFAAAEGDVARVYEAGEWRPVATLEGHQGAVNTVAFSADVKVLVTAGEDGTIRSWRGVPLAPPGAQDPKPEMRYVRAQGHSSITRAFFTPGTHVVVVAGVDMTVRFFDADTGALLRRINGTSPFLSMAGSSEGLYAALSQDNQVVLVGAASQSAVARLDTDDAANSVAVSADGGVVAIANRDGRLRAWKVTPGARVLSLPAPKGFGIAGAVAVAPSARRAAVGDAGGHVLVFDLPTGKLEKILELPQGEVTGLAWSPGAGKWIAAAGADEAVSLFEAATGARTALEGHTGPVNAVAFHPEGKLLATAGSDGTVRLWEVGSPAPRATLSASEKPLYALAFSADGKLFAAGGEDRTVRIYETQGRKLKRKIDGLPEAVLSLAFSPHASILATSGRDQAVRTFRVSNGEARSVWSGHGARVRAVAFAPDGETLASASSDGTIRIWDVRSGRQVVRFERPPEARALAYSKDGSLLVSAGERPALLAVEMGDKASLLPPEEELSRQLKRRKLRLEGIELVEDDEQLAQRTLGKKK